MPDVDAERRTWLRRRRPMTVRGVGDHAIIACRLRRSLLAGYLQRATLSKMRLFAIEGTIDRRLLVNYRVEPELARAVVPPPFRPQLVHGSAVAGICLLRMTDLRPRHTPRWLGLRSENAAHRIAVEWDTAHGTTRGVYIPRRDSASLLNVVVGGRLYPGTHHHARFEVHESDDELAVRFTSDDGSADVEVQVAVTDSLSGSALFTDVADASAFFQQGNIGYSATRNETRFDGVELVTDAWSIDAATVLRAHSSFFEDRATFPPGTAVLDSALLMRRIPVHWIAHPQLDASAEPAPAVRAP